MIMTQLFLQPIIIMLHSICNKRWRGEIVSLSLTASKKICLLYLIKQTSSCEYQLGDYKFKNYDTNSRSSRNLYNEIFSKNFVYYITILQFDCFNYFYILASLIHTGIRGIRRPISSISGKFKVLN